MAEEACVTNFPDPAPMPERRDPNEGTPRFEPLDGSMPGSPTHQQPAPGPEPVSVNVGPGGVHVQGAHSPTSTPTCWQCGYTLSGLGVDGQCPECGTPVWSSRGIDQSLQKVQRHASNAQLWGILSLVFFFGCVGPLAAFATIPVFISAKRAKRAMTAGRISKTQVSSLTADLVCAWITIGLTCLVVGIYALLFMAAFVL